ncbi:hypothetical protein QJS04_geneDACA005443 [Acorus gramineus]|uniref:Uncharacterized protein n=1 Tax=Acorus gramineus TaxID=55184 RepID=A0AAV9A632_ACOGR|nr:hypothetical protein QJS04_geneDACA005443 [Acorus gramineus]
MVRVGGIEWTNLGGGSTVQIDMVDILSISWLRVHGGSDSSELDVKANSQRLYKFVGFLFAGNSLAFSSESKEAFEIPLMDISTTKVIGQNDVAVNFHTDDTTSDTDALVSLTFHVPDDNPQFGGHKTQSVAKVFQRSITANKASADFKKELVDVTKAPHSEDDDEDSKDSKTKALPPQPHHHLSHDDLQSFMFSPVKESIVFLETTHRYMIDKITYGNTDDLSKSSHAAHSHPLLPSQLKMRNPKTQTSALCDPGE